MDRRPPADAMIGLVTRSLIRLLIVLSAVLAAGAGVAQATTTPAGGFTIRPNIADSGCNGGHGVQLATNGFRSAAIASGLLADGSSLTSFGQIYPGQPYVVLDAVTTQCTPDAQFGNGGTTHLTIPSSLVADPGNVPGNFGLWIDAIAPRSGGGALLAGSYRARWVVAAITASGALDPTFGAGGWIALPQHGEATAITQERSGEVVVAGDNSGGGCCTVNHAAGLTEQGEYDPDFGHNGSVVLPTGEDSGVSSLSLLPDGDILAQVNYGNMGCWGHQLDLLTSMGRPVVRFTNSLNRFWRTHTFGAFVGDAYADGNEITLVGVGQRPCADGPKITAKSAHGVLAHFAVSGRIIGRMVRFASPLYGEIDAFQHGPNTLLAESSFASESSELLRVIKPNGAVAKSFGTHGLVRIRLPWQGAQASYDDQLATAQAGPSSLVLVATENGRRTMAVMRLDV